MLRLDRLCRHCIDVWNAVDEHVLCLEKVPYEVQRKNGERIYQLLAQKEFYEEDPSALLEYVKKDCIWNLQVLSEEDGKEFCRITKQFIDEARAFDDQLDDAAIFQALRNVWIILMLGLLMRGTFYYHDAVFSYSMLYPYTDNFLDDPTVSDEEKREFNKRLRRRLKGHAYEQPKEQEEKIDCLIGKIESVFHREEYPLVYESLLCIQKGQEDSLKQGAWREDLLYISVQKGGSSVLADGYLLDGKLHEEEQRFCMEYGFSLQLADDLQDMKEDREHDHYTLFCYEPCESLVKRLLVFMQDMMKRQRICTQKEICGIVEKGCLFLVLGVVILHQEEFTKGFLHEVYAAFPLHASQIAKIMDADKPTLGDLMNLFETGTAVINK